MTDETSNYENAQRFAGRVVLVGFLCLILAMMFGLASVASIDSPGSSRTLMTLTKVFGFLWLPLVGIGVLMRLTNTKPEPQDTDSQSGT